LLVVVANLRSILVIIITTGSDQELNLRYRKKQIIMVDNIAIDMSSIKEVSAEYFFDVAECLQQGAFANLYYPSIWRY